MVGAIFALALEAVSAAAAGETPESVFAGLLQANRYPLALEDGRLAGVSRFSFPAPPAPSSSSSARNTTSPRSRS